MKCRSTMRGFTLLEAIVALTVMALALVPLVTFIAQSANELERAAEVNDQSFTKQSVLALMDPINPMAEPNGELELDENIAVSWQSETLVPPNSHALIGGVLNGYRVGFYGVQVAVTRREEPWFSFEMRKVGYENTRAPGTMFGVTP